MTRDEALANLSSTDTDSRLKAARFFALKATGSDRRRLRVALKKETVPWIIRALERAIQRVDTTQSLPERFGVVYADPPQRVVAELRARAIDDVAGTIIHELSTIVASLKLVAPRDINNYSGSRIETLVNSLASLLVGIRNLKAAASKANYRECDLSQECRDACGIFVEHSHLFRYAGQAPFLIEIDPDLLKLALANIIKNAVEAVVANPGHHDGHVTLNWGKAGRECWVSVLDSGIGFEKDPSLMIDFGKSTKKDHIGFGLATAKQAMQTMEGDIYPANAADGGARVVLRWFISDENSVR